MLQRQRGGLVAGALLPESNSTRLVQALNLWELYDHKRRLLHTTASERSIKTLKSMSLSMREDLDGAFRRATTSLKVACPSAFLADRVAVRLVRRLGGELVSTNCGDPDALHHGGMCRVSFVR